MRARPERRGRARGTRAACAAAWALCCAALLAPAAHAFSWVSYPALVEQIRSGRVIRVIVNRELHDAEIKFRNLYEWKARFAPSQETPLVSLVRGRHIPLIFAAPPRSAHAAAPAVHHRLRWIATAVLLATLLLVAAVLERDRRARARETGAAGAAAQERHAQRAAG